MHWLSAFNRFHRWALEDLHHSRIMYRSRKIEPRIAFPIQHSFMPFETIGIFVDYLNETHPIWPLWLCPMRRGALHLPFSFTSCLATKLPSISRDIPWLADMAALATTEQPQRGEDGMMLDIGVRGHEGTLEPSAFVAKNRAIEVKVCSLESMKWPYAHMRWDHWQVATAPR